MTFVSIPNGVRIVHVATLDGIPIVNTFGVQNGVGTTGSDLSALASSHATAWRAHIVPALNPIYVHTATLAYSLEDRSAPVGEATLTGTGTGGNNGTPMPSSSCMVFALKTDKRGRSYQGRSYLSGLNTAAYNSDGRTWIAGALASYVGLMNSYKSDVDPALNDNGALSICSKGSPLNDLGPHVEKVTTIVGRAVLGTQRGRLT